jgi:uncharacterized membrane protein
VKSYLLAYLATATTMLVLDAVWLGVIAMPIYNAGIGHLMAAQVNALAAVAFYLMFVAGLMHFVVLPSRQDAAWSDTAITGALFGLFTYATYDLTNLATLRDWPLHIVVLDVVWGMFISATAASAGRAALRRMAAGRLRAA